MHLWAVHNILFSLQIARKDNYETSQLAYLVYCFLCMYVVYDTCSIPLILYSWSKDSVFLYSMRMQLSLYNLCYLRTIIIDN